MEELIINIWTCQVSVLFLDKNIFHERVIDTNHVHTNTELIWVHIYMNVCLSTYASTHTHSATTGYSSYLEHPTSTANMMVSSEYHLTCFNCLHLAPIIIFASILCCISQQNCCWLTCKENLKYNVINKIGHTCAFSITTKTSMMILHCMLLFSHHFYPLRLVMLLEIYHILLCSKEDVIKQKSFSFL